MAECYGSASGQPYGGAIVSCKLESSDKVPVMCGGKCTWGSNAIESCMYILALLAIGCLCGGWRQLQCSAIVDACVDV